jgi:hypothetical protein
VFRQIIVFQTLFAKFHAKLKRSLSGIHTFAEFSKDLSFSDQKMTQNYRKIEMKKIG